MYSRHSSLAELNALSMSLSFLLMDGPKPLVLSMYGVYYFITHDIISNNPIDKALQVCSIF